MNATLKRQNTLNVRFERRLYQDMVALVSQAVASVRRASRKAMLYRTSTGENPYDFSHPETQRTYLSFNKPNFM